MNKNRYRDGIVRLLAGAVVLIAVMTHTSFGQRLAVIVHADVPAISADAKTLLNIYALNTQSWKDGSKITLFTLQGNQKIMQQFHNFIGRSPLELRKIWLRFQLSGEGKSPAALASESEMVERVAAQPGAVGFVSADAVKPNVKVIVWID